MLLDPSTESYLPATVNLDQTFTYDNEGRLTQMAYPPESAGMMNGSTTTVAGPVYNVTYDTMGRSNGMAEGTTSEVNSVAYNAASQMTNVCYFGYCDARSYNSMGQLTEISDPTEHETFAYPAGANNGKFSSQTNVFTGGRSATPTTPWTASPRPLRIRTGARTMSTTALAISCKRTSPPAPPRVWCGASTPEPTRSTA